MFWIYNILLTLFSPLWVPWMLIRANKRAEKVNWQERQGNLQLALRDGSDRIWFHAVSVGEVVAAIPILKELRNIEPEIQIVLSVTTSSGHETARKQAKEYVDEIVYFPIDVVRFTLNAMARVEPKAVVVMETELWFNFFWAAKTVHAQTLVVNGRLSDRSFNRSSKFRFFFQSLLSMVDGVFVQTESDATRFKDLGAKHVETIGNCKFDQAIDGVIPSSESLRQEFGIPQDAQVVVVGSTRGEFEEEFVIKALQDLRIKDLWIIHAPRHMETVPGLTKRAEQAFGSVALRSNGEIGRYMILDTYGELSKIYGLADIVIIGGGFDKLGGQNLIQPLAHGKPVIHGKHMFNFRDVSEMANQAGATIIVETSEELADTIYELMNNQNRKVEMGKLASGLVTSNLGASAKYAKKIVEAVKLAPGIVRKDRS